MCFNYRSFLLPFSILLFGLDDGSVPSHHSIKQVVLVAFKTWITEQLVSFISDLIIVQHSVKNSVLLLNVDFGETIDVKLPYEGENFGRFEVAVVRAKVLMFELFQIDKNKAAIL